MENSEKMQIEITEKQYFEELKLMKKQYGQEEELYPWIYMLLRKSIFEKGNDNLSMRNVCSGRKAITVPGRKLLSGGISFPDIAILRKDFDINENFAKNNRHILGCVEAKHMEEKLLVENEVDNEKIDIETKYEICILPSPSRPHYWYKREVESKDDIDVTISSEKTKIKIKWDGKRIECVNGFKDNILEIKTRDKIITVNAKEMDEDWELDFLECYKKTPPSLKSLLCRGKIYISITEKTYIKVGEEKILLYIKKGQEDIEYTDANQLFGELLWYGKVLYTNGLQWKYLKITGSKYGLSELRSLLYKNCIEGDEKWYEVIKEQNINIDCKELIDFDENDLFNKYIEKDVVDLPNLEGKWNILLNELDSFVDDCSGEIIK